MSRFFRESAEPKKMKATAMKPKEALTLSSSLLLKAKAMEPMPSKSRFFRESAEPKKKAKATKSVVRA
jgi:hypothetical protein